MHEIHPWTFRVDGHPEPGGSKTAIPIKKGDRYLTGPGGRPVVQVVDANPKVRKWMRAVKKQVEAQWSREPFEIPVSVSMVFYLHRWKSHYGTGSRARILKDSAPITPAGDHADATKLFRSTEDALTGVLWKDDSLVGETQAIRRYAPGYVLRGMEGEYATIEVMPHRLLTIGEQRAQDQLRLTHPAGAGLALSL